MLKRILTVALLLFTFAAGAQPPKVPASVTFAGQTVRFDRSDIYERMDRELLTFTYMHSTSTLMLKRAARVFEIVEPILKENGVPDDLKYLMVIESNLDPFAVSRAGAAGYWQFMQGTAREFGLEVNANVDERYNLEKSTVAACKYLKNLYARYGDWMSVAASYNAGPAMISKRMAEQGETSAMDLWLVSETSRYMFRILACKMLFADPASFGFRFSEEDSYKKVPVLETVTVTEEIPDLVAFAKNHHTSYAALKRANPWLCESKLNNTTKRTYKIVIPAVDDIYKQ